MSAVLRTAIERSMRIDQQMRSTEARMDTLPMLVAAIVGDIELYPLQLHWAVRHLAVSPGLQRALREDCRSSISTASNSSSFMCPASKQPNAGSATGSVSALDTHSLSYGSLVRKFVTFSAWARPFSTSGVPRKLIDDLVVSVNVAADGEEKDVRNVTLEKGAILQIEHDWNAMFLATHNEPATSRELPLQEACEMRNSTVEAGDKLRRHRPSRWSMFGMGDRACLAADMSVSFLASMLCTVLSKYEVGIAEPFAQCTVRDFFAYEEDGSLLVPKRSDIRITLTPLR